MAIIWVDGSWKQSDQPVLSHRHRGARYGDGVFETIRIENGRPQHLGRHLSRLRQGMDALGLPCPSDIWPIGETIARNVVDQGVLRIAISRGGEGFGYRPAPSAPAICVIEASSWKPAAGALSAHVARYRRVPPACLPTGVKTAQCLGSVLALGEAEAAGVDEALMLSVEGHLASFASGNLVWRKGEQLFTPPLETGCLAGIARELLIERAGLSECLALPERLSAANAVLLVNSVRGLVPIERIDPIGHFAGSAALGRELGALLDDREAA